MAAEGDLRKIRWVHRFEKVSALRKLNLPAGPRLIRLNGGSVFGKGDEDSLITEESFEDDDAYSVRGFIKMVPARTVGGGAFAPQHVLPLLISSLHDV